MTYLARREHTRAELFRKLAPHAASEDELNTLLDDLIAKRLLSDERYAASIARMRGERYGAARVRQELRAKGVGAEHAAAAVAGLKETDLARARALWQRKFGRTPQDVAERAKQLRFFLARGFSLDVARRVIGGDSSDDEV